ncbi:MAG: hypothetical protein KKD38_00805 [Candidatus Delongbacteria bacterium]|nr:hypothetical protein [Candidatus Delongbacteria bacterium]MCG2760364.1 hypothetical protein [Candidatus Delongbacteria bacterium]
MIKIKIKIFSSAIFLLILFSCSQKYDSSGIFNPQDPNFFAATVSEITQNDTIAIPINSINNGYIYIGRDIVSAPNDTTAWAESVFKVDLPDTTNLDSAIYIVYKINTSEIADIENKKIKLFKTPTDWTGSIVESTNFELLPYNIIDITAITAGDTISSYQIRINLDLESIAQWASNDSVDTQPESFYLRSLSGNEVSPILKMYSSKWGYDSGKPKIYFSHTYLDTLTAVNGSDSITNVTKADSTYISDDFSLVRKKSSCLDILGDKIKLGGISGESYLCKIDIPDSIPSNATVLTGRIDLTAIESEVDPVYGNISNSVTANKEICIYIMSDSLWYSPEKVLNYDTLNVWSYKINLGDSTNYFVMDTAIQKWIKNPASNYGFLITAQNWGSPFGYSVFLKPKINVSYITIEE